MQCPEKRRSMQFCNPPKKMVGIPTQKTSNQQQQQQQQQQQISLSFFWGYNRFWLRRWTAARMRGRKGIRDKS